MASGSKHTPGPWRVEKDTTLVWGHCDPDLENQTSYAMGYPVADALLCPHWNRNRGPHDGQPDWDTAKANADLIASAPDLLTKLDALKRDLSVAIAGLKDQLDGHWATWMAARAHIDGAETRQLFEREPDVMRARALIAKFEA